MESVSNGPHLTPLSDELFQDTELLFVLRLIALRIMNNQMFVVFRGDSFVDVGAGFMRYVLEAVERSEMNISIRNCITARDALKMALMSDDFPTPDYEMMTVK